MWPFGKKDPFDQILRAHLDGDFSLFACGQNAPKIQVIEEFETTYGVTLPPEFREFSISKLGGIYIEAKPDVWPRAKEHEVAPFWSFLYGIAVYGFADDIPEFMAMRVQAKQFQESTQTRNVPFMRIMGDANVYCFNEAGMISRWDHEMGEFAPSQKTFSQTFDAEVKGLRERKDRKVIERQKAT